MTDSTKAAPPPVEPAAGQPAEEGPSSHERPGAGIPYDRFLDCVHCGLCTSACPTYLETGNENDSPRGRIYLMRAVADGKLELTETVRRHLDLCLDCRSCETACPSGVQYGRLIEPFRVETSRADARTGRKSGGWFERLFLDGLFPYPHRMRRALWPARMMQKLGIMKVIEATRLTRLLPKTLRRMHALLPRLQPPGEPLPEVLPAIGERRARVALFTGCVAEAMFPQTNRATARVLQQNGCEVLVPPGQGCCGAVQYHGGRGEEGLAFADRNAAAFNPDEVDAVLVNVAGCGSMLKDYGHIAEELAPEDGPRRERLAKLAGKVRDVSEFLAELGLREPPGEIRLRATYHDACHLVHAQGVRSQPRTLLAAIPGLQLVPLPESEICCGAAGSYNLTEPEMADRLARRKVENIRATGAEAVITGNAGCNLQIASALRHGRLVRGAGNRVGLRRERRGKRPQERTGLAGRQAGSAARVLHPMDLLDASYRNESPAE